MAGAAVAGHVAAMAWPGEPHVGEEDHESPRPIHKAASLGSIAGGVDTRPECRMSLGGHHRGSITHVAFSPDGSVLASAFKDPQIVLWDMPSCKHIGALEGNTGPVLMVSWHRKGNLLAAACYDHVVILWDTRTRRKVQTLTGFRHPVISVAFQPRGDLLAVGSKGMGVSLQLWDVPGRASSTFSFGSGRRTRARKVGTLDGHTDFVMDIAWAPEGNTLVSGSRDGTAAVWNADTLKRVAVLQGHTGTVSSVAMHPNGTILATGSRDETIILWDLGTCQQLGQLIGHSDGVRTLAFSDDCTTLVSGGWDSTIMVWCVTQQQPLATLGGHGDVVNSVALCNRGTLATGSRDCHVKVWSGIRSAAWSTRLHHWLPPVSKTFVKTVLMAARRVSRVAEGEGARRVGTRGTKNMALPHMPDEMWYTILQQLSPRDMHVLPKRRRAGPTSTLQDIFGCHTRVPATSDWF
eukprot:m.183538 g.183538  ORF g.183538 m.183538 type:complete len:464 (+) comp15840_c0_seq1:263-1654(+)